MSNISDNKGMQFAIVTPVYNGSQQLWDLYNCLEKSSDKDFTWIIINDGSVDDTKSIMEKIEVNSSFTTYLLNKTNGGKCRALNTVFNSFPNFDFYMIVDCDEQVVENAISNIKQKVLKYWDNETIGSLYIWRNMQNDPIVSKCFENRPNKDFIVTYHEKCIIGKFHQGGAIGYYKRLIDKYRFREFEGEKYLGESTLLLQAVHEKKLVNTVLTDAVLSKGEYLEGGLTNQGRALRIHNPYGMIYYSGLLAEAPIRLWKLKLKYSIGVQAYAFISHINKNDLIKKGINPKYKKWWALIPGVLLGVYWKKKYL